MSPRFPALAELRNSKPFVPAKQILAGERPEKNRCQSRALLAIRLGQSFLRMQRAAATPRPENLS